MIHAITNLTAKEKFTIQLEFLSDWHIGSGMGRPGDVDRLVQRDCHKLPYIPAKSLTGIWRDACERVAYGLDNGQPDGVWQQWVTYLFGDQPADPERPVEEAEAAPRPAVLSVRSAHFPEALQNALIPKPRLHDLICIIKPGIKIEALTGCAEPDCLRMEERVRGGAVLTADCKLNLPADEDSRKTAYALLVAGTQFMERIGGKRRRGAGKCRCTVPGESINGWISWIGEHRQPEPPPTSKKQDDPSAPTSTPELEPNSDGSWECFDLVIEAHSPLVIAAHTIGNVVESLDYIPGNYLLRLLLNRFRQLNLLDSTAIHRAIAQHDLVITPATIEIGSKPGRPVPLCWEADKQAGGLRKGGRVYNSFTKTEDTEDEDSNLQLKGERGYYIGQSDGNSLPDSAKVIKGIATHNVIDDRFQRPTEEVGGVFSYEAIAPKTRFRAQLRLRHTLAHQLKQAYRDQQTKQPKTSDWWIKLSGKERIGVSKKDDYGAVELSVQKAGLPKHLSQGLERGQLLYIWLLSDTLIRDQRLRFSTQVEDLKQELSKSLGSDITLHTVDIRQQTSRVESWQCSWGLPRPSMVGIQAGSCFVFRIDSDISAESLQRVQIEGIGDRTAEGYGQVCFNDPLIMKPTSDMEAPQSSTSGSSNSEQAKHPLLGEQSDGFDYARIIEREAWRDAIRWRSLEIAADSDKREEYLALNSTNPPNSQLGALNSTLRQLRTTDESDQQTVIQWINKIREISNRHDKWKVADRSPALSKIEALIDDHSQIWQILTPKAEDGEQPNSKFWDEITLTASGNEHLRQEIWAEAVRIFIDACIRAHRRDQEKLESAQLAAQGVSNGAES